MKHSYKTKNISSRIYLQTVRHFQIARFMPAPNRTILYPVSPLGPVILLPM